MIEIASELSDLVVECSKNTQCFVYSIKNFGNWMTSCRNFNKI